MLRTLAVLLVLANLVFFAWARGWLAPAAPPPLSNTREPQRLAAQVHPERVTVMPSQAASAAIRSAQDAAARCLEAGPFDEDSVQSAEAVLKASAQDGTTLPAGTWARRTVQPGPSYLVLAGGVTDAASRNRRAAELQRLGLAFEPLDPPAAGAPGLMLSRHADRAAAEAALAAATATGLRGASVVERPAPPAQWWLRAERAGTTAQVALLALQAPALAGGFRPCEAP